MLLVAMAYYLWAVGSGLPGLRLAVVFVDIQSFPESSRLHQLPGVPASPPGNSPVCKYSFPEGIDFHIFPPVRPPGAVWLFFFNYLYDIISALYCQ